MSKNKITASEMLAKFKGASPAVVGMYSRVLANRHKAPPTVFQERKPAVFSPAMLNHERPSLPEAPKMYSYRTLPSHVASSLRGYRSVEQAEDSMYEVLAGLAALSGKPNRRYEARLRERGLKPLAIGNVESPTQGGYLQPVQTTSAIWQRMADYGVARQLCTIVPAESGAATIPVQTSMPTVYRVNELGSITPNDISWGSLGINIEKRTTLHKFSAELTEDSAIPLLDGMVTQTALALAGAEDDDLINGAGDEAHSNEVGLLAAMGSAGIHTPSNGTGKSVWSGFTITEFAATMAKLPAQYFSRAAWLVHPAFFATAMVPLSAALGVSPSGRPLFCGYEVFLSSKMPASTATSQISAFFGSFADGVVLADRSLNFFVTDKAPGLFELNLVALRVTSRIDLNCHNVGDSSNAGAVVALKTAAS